MAAYTLYATSILLLLCLPLFVLGDNIVPTQRHSKFISTVYPASKSSGVYPQAYSCLSQSTGKDTQMCYVSKFQDNNLYGFNLTKLVSDEGDSNSNATSCYNHTIQLENITDMHSWSVIHYCSEKNILALYSQTLIYFFDVTKLNFSNSANSTVDDSDEVFCRPTTYISQIPEVSVGSATTVVRMIDKSSTDADSYYIHKLDYDSIESMYKVFYYVLKSQTSEDGKTSLSITPYESVANIFGQEVPRKLLIQYKTNSLNIADSGNGGLSNSGTQLDDNNNTEPGVFKYANNLLGESAKGGEKLEHLLNVDDQASVSARDGNRWAKVGSITKDDDITKITDFSLNYYKEYNSTHSILFFYSREKNKVLVTSVSVADEELVFKRLYLFNDANMMWYSREVNMVVDDHNAYFVLNSVVATSSNDGTAPVRMILGSLSLSNLFKKLETDRVSHEGFDLPVSEINQTADQYSEKLREVLEGNSYLKMSLITQMEVQANILTISLEPVAGQLFLVTYSNSQDSSTPIVLRGYNPLTLKLVTLSNLFDMRSNTADILRALFYGYKKNNPNTLNRVAILKSEKSYGYEGFPSSCPEDCYVNSGYGNCVKGACVCATGRLGYDCSKIQCNVSDCGESEGRGECDYRYGICKCSDLYTGETCNVRQCPKGCSNNGNCSGSPDYKCTCEVMWAGEDCATEAMNACYTYKKKEDCILRARACGWCGDENICVRGDHLMPKDGYCAKWEVEYAMENVLKVVMIFLIVLIAVFFLANVSSIIGLDYVTAAILQSPDTLLTSAFLKEVYWRDERSSKLWKLFDCLQQLCLVLLLNAIFPTVWVQLSRYFQLVIFFLPNLFPSLQEPVVFPSIPTTNSALPKMSLISYQLGNSGRVKPSNIFPVTIASFLVVALISILVYLVYALLMSVMLKSKEPNIFSVLFGRFFHLLTRLIIFAYMPLVTVSCFYIAHTYNAGITVVAVIVLVVVGILVPLFNWFIVHGKGKHLLFLHLKIRFGALYSCYHYQKAMFNLIYMGRKLLVSALIGFLASDSTENRVGLLTTQLVLIILVHVIYIIALAAIRPYLDPVHFFLDILINILSVVFFGSIFMIRDDVSYRGIIFAGVCVILQIVCCLVAYLITWFNILLSPIAFPWIIFGPRYNGEFYPTNADEMKVLSRQEVKKQRTTLNSTLPTRSKRQEVETNIEESLQSSD